MHHTAPWDFVVAVELSFCSFEGSEQVVCWTVTDGLGVDQIMDVSNRYENVLIQLTIFGLFTDVNMMRSLDEGKI